MAERGMEVGDATIVTGIAGLFFLNPGLAVGILIAGIGIKALPKGR